MTLCRNVVKTGFNKEYQITRNAKVGNNIFLELLDQAGALLLQKFYHAQ